LAQAQATPDQDYELDLILCVLDKEEF